MKLITTNNKANHEYFIEDTFEAGLVLTGSEVKSLRENSASITESFVNLRKGELYIINSYIAPYNPAHIKEDDSKKPRKLLLHKNQIKKIIGSIKKAGYTGIVLKLYFNDKGKVKAEIAIAKGKHTYDKRQAIKTREWKRDKSRLLNVRK